MIPYETRERHNTLATFIYFRRLSICIMVYLMVLYIEFVPIVCERFLGRVKLPRAIAFLARPVEALLRVADRTLARTLTLLILVGVVLSCMHHSSLGALMLISPYKVHPLWYTPILPLLFLLSAVSVGYFMVIVESILSARWLGRKPQMEVLTSLSRLALLLLGIYLAAKLSDMVIREAFVYLWDGSLASVMFLVEVCGGVIAPFLMLLSERVRQSPTGLLIASLLVGGGLVINRVNVFLVAYAPPYATRAYFPSIYEIVITLGMAAAVILVYRMLVAIFPILPAAPRLASQPKFAKSGR